MLALLNDGAILSIAYDNVHYKDQPEAWNMRLVLGISTVMGLFGVAAAFGLFYLGDRVFHLDHAHVQTLMYLKLSVAGHLTIFLTRTRGPFWSIRPARILLIAVFGTQAIATLIAVYGLFMTPLGWGWAGFVWAYAIAWFLVTDRVKLLAYRVLDHIKAETKMETKAAPKPDAKADAPKPAGRAGDPKPGGKAGSPKPGASKPDAETGDPKADPSKPNAAADAPKPDAKAGTPNLDAKNEPQPEAKAEPAPGAKSPSKPEGELKPEAKPDSASVLNKTLGDILVAGMTKDPEDAGRLIAAAIAKPDAAPQAPEAGAETKPQTEAQPKDGPTRQPISTPKAAE